MLEIGFVTPVATGGTANSTAGLATILSLLCPSESLSHPISFGGDWAQSNYAGNYGGPGMITSCNGIIVPSKGDQFVSSPNLGPVSIAAVVDGTSNTAMFSEHLLGAGNGLDGLTPGYVSPYVAGTLLAKRCLFQVSSVSPLPDKGAAGLAVAQQLVSACKSIPGGTVPTEDSGTGYAWLYTQGYDTLNLSYSHVMTPNSYSCTGAESGFFGGQGNFTSDSSGGGWLGASTATSNHPGGINVGMGDGSVKFIKDSVSIQAWWGLGTRNQGEIVSSDSY
jgi:prepilin-type processing-associated H-X9-DG protein